jgi:hypothetical protein
MFLADMVRLFVVVNKAGDEKNPSRTEVSDKIGNITKFERFKLTNPPKKKKTRRMSTPIPMANSQAMYGSPNFGDISPSRINETANHSGHYGLDAQNNTAGGFGAPLTTSLELLQTNSGGW